MFIEYVKNDYRETAIRLQCDKCKSIRTARKSRLYDTSFTLCNKCFPNKAGHVCNEICQVSTRICGKCSKEKLLAEFDVKNFGLTNGHAANCKQCTHITKQLRLDKNKIKNQNHSCVETRCNEIMWYCRKCKTSQPLSFFNFSAPNKNGHHAYCAYCHTQIETERNPSRIKRGITFHLTQDEFFNLMRQPCAICRGYAPNKLTNGIDRADNTKSYTPDNTVPMCTECNMFKGSWHLDEYIAYLKAIAPVVKRRFKEGVFDDILQRTTFVQR